MDNKTIQDVNVNLQHQNDLIKKELIEKIQYIQILENDNENMKNKITHLEIELNELNKYKNEKENKKENENEKENEKESTKNTSILNYIWNSFIPTIKTQ